MAEPIIRILVVEDSGIAAKALTRLLNEFEVVGVATTGADAIAMDERLVPDVITVDIHLPDTNGVDLTRQLRARRDVPIIIISSRVEAGGQRLVFEALRAGAYDVLRKDGLVSGASITPEAERLISLIKGAVGRARRDAVRHRPVTGTPAPTARLRTPTSCVAIGASTGGPAALRDIFEALPADLALFIVVAQHMSEAFVGGFVSWLDSQVRIEARVAADGERPRNGVAYFAPGGSDLVLATDLRLGVTAHTGPAPSPSANALFRSVAGAVGGGAICLLLTGMGNDGAEGMLEARRRRAITVAQDEATSVIFGMPRRAIELGGAQLIMPLGEIGPWLARQGQPP